MSNLTLVRHGQACFFSDNYDWLSELGEDQARVLGRYWVEQGVRVDRVFSGQLERQIRTAALVGEAFREAGRDWPETRRLAGLNEYPADEIIETLLPELSRREPRIRELHEAFEQAVEETVRYRTVHRLLEAVMDHWITGDYDSHGLLSWRDFSDGVRDALRSMLAVQGSGVHVATFTSGGPIGISVQTTLEAPEHQAAQINWRVHNCSMTRFTFSGARVSLDAFNAVPHLYEDRLLTFR